MAELILLSVDVCTQHGEGARVLPQGNDAVRARSDAVIELTAGEPRVVSGWLPPSVAGDRG